MKVTNLSPTPAPSPLPTPLPGKPTLVPTTLRLSTPNPTAFPTNYFPNAYFLATLAYSVQNFTVPEGVTYILVFVYGAQGHDCTGCFGGTWVGGLGGMVEATVSVTQGQVMFVYVGGMGLGAPSGTSDAGGYNGGGSGDTKSAGLRRLVRGLYQLFS